MGDWTTDAPGVRRKITPADLPPPYATKSAENSARRVPRPDGAVPQVPPGFQVTLFASGLQEPRMARVAPNGDLFVTESESNRIRVLRDADGDGKPEVVSMFAEGLRQPFGMAFHPAADPKWLYVANTDSIVRFPYSAGDTKARGAASDVYDKVSGGGRLPGGGHWTRDIVFSRDGSKMYVSVGSRSNVSDNDAEARRARILRALARRHERARLRVRDPEPGGSRHPSRHRRALDVGQRARRARRQPRPRLRHEREGRRLLRLAVVLHRPEPGPASRRQTPRAARQGHRARRPHPVALGVARDDVLHGHSSSPRPTAAPRSPPSTGRGTGRGARATRSSTSR